MCRPWHLSRSLTEYTTVRAVPSETPRGGCALALTQASDVWRRSAKHVLIRADVGVTVVMLMARTAHLVHVRAACPAPRRARHGTDERRAVRVRTLHGHRHGHRRGGTTAAATDAGTSYCMRAARARDAVVMVVVMVVVMWVVLGRRNEVRRRALLTKCRRRHRGRHRHLV